MKKNLSKLKKTFKRKVSQSTRSKGIKFVEIKNITYLLKTSRNRRFYNNEKETYILLKNETFLPTLKYYDDKHCMLCLTDCGDSLAIYMSKYPLKYNQLYQSFNEQLKIILDILYNKYRLYHNDLYYKNICVDKNDKIYIIDFDSCSKELRPERPRGRNRRGVMRGFKPAATQHFTCEPIDITEDPHTVLK
jgi:thiamine kinase-like enzyme